MSQSYNRPGAISRFLTDLTGGSAPGFLGTQEHYEQDYNAHVAAHLMNTGAGAGTGQGKAPAPAGASCPGDSPAATRAVQDPSPAATVATGSRVRQHRQKNGSHLLEFDNGDKTHVVHVRNVDWTSKHASPEDIKRFCEFTGAQPHIENEARDFEAYATKIVETAEAKKAASAPQKMEAVSSPISQMESTGVIISGTTREENQIHASVFSRQQLDEVIRDWDAKGIRFTVEIPKGAFSGESRASSRRMSERRMSARRPSGVTGPVEQTGAPDFRNSRGSSSSSRGGSSRSSAEERRRAVAQAEERRRSMAASERRRADVASRGSSSMRMRAQPATTNGFSPTGSGVSALWAEDLKIADESKSGSKTTVGSSSVHIIESSEHCDNCGDAIHMVEPEHCDNCGDEI